MLTTVKARPNHYEMLGLSPNATSNEIARAFAREVSTFRPRPFGATAGISIAYAILRDPAKRRAYDASIGLLPEPEPDMPALTRVEFRYKREGTPASFVAAPQPVAAPAAQPAPPSSPLPLAATRKPAGAPLSIRDQVEEMLAHRGSAWDAAPDQALAGWNRPGLTVAALLMVAAAIGVFAGLQSVETIEPEQSTGSATIGLSPAAPAKAAEPPVVQTTPTRAEPQPRVRTTESRPAARREAAAEAVTALPVESITESIQVVRTTPADAAVDDRSSEQAVAAALPIANREVARTIERIGYACGAVDSAVPVEGGGAGVFKVSCTSGDLYRAAPIRGRYHFRRWDRR